MYYLDNPIKGIISFVSFTRFLKNRKPQETHQWMNPKQSESRATRGIDVIGLDLPHSLIGNIIFRCSKEAAGKLNECTKTLAS
jgi:hypothetical protein